MVIAVVLMIETTERCCRSCGGNRVDAAHAASIVQLLLIPWGPTGSGSLLVSVGHEWYHHGGVLFGVIIVLTIVCC